MHYTTSTYGFLQNFLVQPIPFGDMTVGSVEVVNLWIRCIQICKQNETPTIDTIQAAILELSIYYNPKWMYNLPYRGN